MPLFHISTERFNSIWGHKQGWPLIPTPVSAEVFDYISTNSDVPPTEYHFIETDTAVCPICQTMQQGLIADTPAQLEAAKRGVN
jgi:hypothetical protein